MIVKDPALRRYIYVIAAAAIAILVLFGLVSDDETQVWLNLVAAVLGLPVAGLAIPNTPAKQAPAENLTVVNTYPPMTPEENVQPGSELYRKPHILYRGTDPEFIEDGPQTSGETPPRTE